VDRCQDVTERLQVVPVVVQDLDQQAIEGVLGLGPGGLDFVVGHRVPGSIDLLAELLVQLGELVDDLVEAQDLDMLREVAAESAEHLVDRQVLFAEALGGDRVDAGGHQLVDQLLGELLLARLGLQGGEGLGGLQKLAEGRVDAVVQLLGPLADHRVLILLVVVVVLVGERPFLEPDRLLGVLDGLLVASILEFFLEVHVHIRQRREGIGAVRRQPVSSRFGLCGHVCLPNTKRKQSSANVRAPVPTARSTPPDDIRERDAAYNSVGPSQLVYGCPWL
jgi:hypothetical protein